MEKVRSYQWANDICSHFVYIYIYIFILSVRFIHMRPVLYILVTHQCECVQNVYKKMCTNSTSHQRVSQKRCVICASPWCTLNVQQDPFSVRLIYV
jgi:hypothetical protein